MDICYFFREIGVSRILRKKKENENLRSNFSTFLCKSMVKNTL